MPAPDLKEVAGILCRALAMITMEVLRRQAQTGGARNPGAQCSFVHMTHDFSAGEIIV